MPEPTGPAPAIPAAARSSDPRRARVGRCVGVAARLVLPFGMVKARIRFHGRGGEGVKLASRVLSRTLFRTGRTVQDSPLYGAERRGAPVAAFVRCADGEPIDERGYIERPDVVVVLDESLLGEGDAGVLDGIDAATLVIVDSPHAADALRSGHGVTGRVVAFDLAAIAVAAVGGRLVAAPAAGLVAKATGLAGWEAVASAVETELSAIGLVPELVARNVTAARHAFERAPFVGLSPRRPPDDGGAGATGFVVPRLPAAIAAPWIRGASSARRSTAGWRVSRPVIDRDRCTRCFLCFALCPEGAIGLDAGDFPLVDYDHCKGCLVCATECPPHAIAAVPEVAP